MSVENPFRRFWNTREACGVGQRPALVGVVAEALSRHSGSPLAPIEEQVAQEEQGNEASVSARFTMRATHKEGYPDFSPTCEEVTIKGRSTWRFANDEIEDYKIRECWFCYDPPGLIKQLGVVRELEGQSSDKG